LLKSGCDAAKAARRAFDRGVKLVSTFIEPEAIALYEKMLDFTALRHKVIANNIANANTPGFRRSDVEFADELDRVLRDKGIAGLRGLRLEVTQPNTTPERNDGNNVSIDKEMGAQAENAILYQVYAQLLMRKFRTMQNILREA
jgi:flagellar basal-body rod protein FlgB